MDNYSIMLSSRVTFSVQKNKIVNTFSTEWGQIPHLFDLMVVTVIPAELN